MGQDYVPSWAKQKVETPEGALEVASAQEGSGRSERIAVAQEPLESKGLFETVGDYGVDRLPWIGTAKEFTEMGGLLMAARRAERGVASQYDMQMLNNWVAEQDRGHTFGGHVANIVGSIPKFALELVSSAGIGKAAVVVGKKGGQEATRA
ncbi:MAG: hypothetical protein GY930_02540, partial [bacterium]|nr:hypothetical protein [bacterium]